jgi:dihydrofolate reductase
MRKIILSLAVSLDGLIEGENGEYDWCSTQSPTAMRAFRAFLKTVDTVFLGRKSFELIGGPAFKGKSHYVFSTTIKKVKGVQLIGDDVKNQVIEIKNRPGKDIWLFGGANLVTFFINERLVDEMVLALVPVVLGKGKPLFSEIKQRTYFNLVEAKQEEGHVSLHYAYGQK